MTSADAHGRRDVRGQRQRPLERQPAARLLAPAAATSRAISCASGVTSSMPVIHSST